MKTLFILNPTSGKNNKQKIKAAVEAYCAEKGNNATLWVWQPENALAARIEQAIAEGVEVIVAVGGDGTVHHVGRHLINTNIALGIVPTGTGNGIAGHYGITKNLKKSLDLLRNPDIKTVDTARIDETPFIGFVGFGLDAKVAYDFAGQSNRTLLKYVSLCVYYYFYHPDSSYEVETEGKKISWTNKVCSVANISEFGSGAKVSPGASALDGRIDLCGLRNLPLWKLGFTVYRIFTGKIDGSPYYDRISGTEFKITRDHAGPAQIDGEPFETKREFVVRAVPKSLRIVVSPKAKGI